jgi:DNA-binding PadR family transcriptional regulator
MTAVAIATERRRISEDLEREILARIDRGGLHICEAELRRKLRWQEPGHGSLLQLLDELERRGLIESAIHFRLTEHGRAQVPADYEPPLRYGTGIPWEVRR